MATISPQKNGRRTIQFISGDGKRRSIRLGKVSQRDAEAIKVKIERLVAASISGHAPDDETSRWIATLDDTMCEKLAAVGLAERRKQYRLQEFLEDYFARRADVKQGTKINWRHTKRNLIDFFGPDKPLREISAGDAKDWELYLKTEARDPRRKKEQKGLGDDTVRKRCSNAKQFFNDAREHELISHNPFSKLKSAVKGNRSRDYFVTLGETHAVLNACPDAQWRLLFALSRFGGLRCPSEHLRLRLEDVDWEKERITIWSPKTEHHAGRESRVIPLFPELRPYLEEVFDQADSGTVYFITKYRNANANLRTQLMKIIRRAGLKPWPKLFQNLRATRQTELEDVFPSHVVNAWIGNSRRIAEKHYLQITEEHFQKAVQNPVQQPAAMARTALQDENKQVSQVLSMPNDASCCDNLPSLRMGDAGFEPATSAV